MAQPSLDERIFQFLKTKRGQPMPAKAIAMALQVPRADVNRLLYHDLELLVTRHDGTPPTYELIDEGPARPARPARPVPRTFIAVDLGNVHDVLPHLIPYADDPDLAIVAFADRAYHGRVPPCITLHQTTSPHKNAADLELIHFVLRKCWEESSHPPLTFLIATKDQQFMHLADIVETYGHQCRFVKDWDELRLYVE